MSNMSQKRYELNSNDDSDEIRVSNDEKVEEIEENHKEMDDEVSNGDKQRNTQYVEDNDSIRVDNVEELRDCSKEMDKGVFGCDDMMNKDCKEGTVSMNENGEGKVMEPEDARKDLQFNPDDAKNNDHIVSHYNVSKSSVHNVPVFKDSYAKAVGNSVSEIDRNLCFVPTCQNECGDEVVIF
ncbi:hypothetical protein Tco_0691186 [Tanacetum coccineum]